MVMDLLFKSSEIDVVLSAAFLASKPTHNASRIFFEVKLYFFTVSNEDLRNSLASMSLQVQRQSQRHYH